MSSCTFLDPVSLLAQSAVSVRLGRRASGSSHSLLASLRQRAPLNESSLQGSTKQASTSAAAPVQALQPVAPEHFEQNDFDDEAAGPVLSLPSHPGRQRLSPLAQGGTLQVALDDAGEPSGGDLTSPALFCRAAGQAHLELQPGEGPPHGLGPPADSLLQGLQTQLGLSPHLGTCGESQPDLPLLRPPQAISEAPGESAWPHSTAATQCYLAGSQVASSTLPSPRQPLPPAPQQSGSQAAVGPPGPASVTPGSSSQPFLGQQQQQQEQQHSTASQLSSSPGPCHGASQRRGQRQAADSLDVEDQLELELQGLAGDEQLELQASLGGSPEASLADGRQPHPQLQAAAGAAPPPGPQPHSPTSTHLVQEPPPRAPPGIEQAHGQGDSADWQREAGGRPGGAEGGGFHASGQPPDDGDGPGTSGRWEGLHGELVACRSPQSLQRFLSLHRRRLGYFLLGATVVHLNQLVREEPPDGEAEWQIVVSICDLATSRLRGSAGRFGSPQLVATVCSLSRLCFYDAPLLREVADVARERAANLTTRQLSGLIWAFGRFHRDFRFQPDPGWAQHLLAAAEPRLTAATAVEASMTLYGMALMEERPPEAAVSALLAAFRSGMPSVGGQELSNAIWALAALQVRPPDDWLGEFLARCERATRTFASGASVARVLYGLARLQVRPPASWMVHFLWQSQRRMNNMDARALVMMLYGLARIRYRPDKEWAMRFMRYTRATVLQAPREARVVGLSTQQLAVQPPPEEDLQAAARRQRELWRQQQVRLWRRGAAATGQPLMPLAQQVPLVPAERIRQQALRDLMAADAVARGGDGSGGALGDSGRGAGAAPALAPKAYATLLWGLSRLAYRPSGTWFQLFCQTVQPRLPSFAPGDLALTLLLMMRLKHRPDVEWMVAYTTSLRARLQQYRADCIVQTLMALGRLCSAGGYDGDAELMNALVLRLEPALPHLDTTELISVLLAATRISPRLPPARITALLAAVLDRLRSVPVAPMAAGGAAPPAPVPIGSSDSDSDPAETASPSNGGKAAEAVQSTAVGSANATGSTAAAAEVDAGTGATTTTTAVVAAALPPITQRECINAVFAVGAAMREFGRVGSVKELSKTLLVLLLPYAEPGAPGLTAGDLAVMLQGVVAAGLVPSPQWLRRHEARARHMLATRRMSPANLLGIQRTYDAIGYQPALIPKLPSEVDEEKEVDEEEEAAQAGKGPKAAGMVPKAAGKGPKAAGKGPAARAPSGLGPKSGRAGRPTKGAKPVQHQPGTSAEGAVPVAAEGGGAAAPTSPSRDSRPRAKGKAKGHKRKPGRPKQGAVEAEGVQQNAAALNVAAGQGGTAPPAFLTEGGLGGGAPARYSTAQAKTKAKSSSRRKPDAVASGDAGAPGTGSQLPS